MVYTLALKYLYRVYFKAKVYTILVHGPLGLLIHQEFTEKLARVKASFDTMGRQSHELRIKNLNGDLDPKHLRNFEATAKPSTTDPEPYQHPNPKLT